MYESTTRNIRVVVQPRYLQSQSRPDEDHFFWAYTITIENRGVEIVTLRSRHWQITDDRGGHEEVKGDGVVGEQPTLAPGESFEYTSGVPLATPSGIMVGTYEMETSGGERFDVAIPAFSLDSPQSHRQIN
ncbi:Co2+/Mg2+ efflux protein ApaG [Nordella sp. HKS 07]|uniref:Co2+/Mg2+ efflux protein ApaG n=1 Tax=Nordella sp. HKS 07 TaxID=2712222 RepID=UPI0013E1FDA2|nr:Co2+/Mg2+ efflux protein ApaG [Nordella sp. HKS 07]QIG48935.1 Co2+/Mg2+ efflux protein ApaG [Nordella sp. HKS 07]